MQELLDKLLLENSVSKRLNGFQMSVNDCFSFICKYHTAIFKNNDLKLKVGKYNSDEEFIAILNKKFNGSFENLMSCFAYEQVIESLPGDIIFVKLPNNNYSVCVQYDNQKCYTSTTYKKKSQDVIDLSLADRLSICKFRPKRE